MKTARCEKCGVSGYTYISTIETTGAGPGDALSVHTRRCYKCKKWLCRICVYNGWQALRRNEARGSSAAMERLAGPPFDDTAYCPECGSALDESACFIATAAMGTTCAWQVDVLREFRDRTLLRSAIGTALVSAYMRWSPSFATWLEHRPRARRAVRTLLVTPTARLVSARPFKPR